MPDYIIHVRQYFKKIQMGTGLNTGLAWFKPNGFVSHKKKVLFCFWPPKNNLTLFFYFLQLLTQKSNSFQK